MVLRRGHARHKNVPDPLEAAPKRVTTIHAQRKFAQGMIRPAMSPIKEKEKRQSGANAGPSSAAGGNSSPAPSASPSTSTAKRPRTVDFINYLAFRPFLGTTLLPQPLKNFTVTTRPQKAEANLATSSSPSKQLSSPTRQEQDENKAKKAKQAKRAVMLSKSKVLDQRQRKTRLNAIVQKGASKVLKPRNRNPPIAQQHLKKVVAASKLSPKMQKLKGRPVATLAKSSHPSILKRLGASKERAGLRSAGQLPPGSDAGIKTDRKPRSAKIALKKHQSASILRNRSNLRTPLRLKTKQNAKRAAAAAIPSKLKRDRILARGNLRAKNTPPNKLNLAVRPSRKTKTAASLYMEMITKDLRSPDEDDESPEKSTESDAGSSTPQNTRQRRSLATSEIDSTPPSSKALKKGTRSSKGSAASPTPSVSAVVKRNPKTNTALPSGKKVKIKKEEEATDSQGDEATTSKTSRKSSPLLKKQVKKSVKSESPEAPKTTAKSTAPKKGVGAKKQSLADDAEDSEASSQSENEEDTGSRSRRTKSSQKSVPPLAKKASLKSAKDIKSGGKSVEKDLSPKRSTRSAGSAADSLPEPPPKTNSSVKASEKKATPGSAAKKASKQTAPTKDSETGNTPSDKLAKSASVKPSSTKKAAVQDSDDSESEDEETSRPSSRSQSAKGSKGAKSAETVEESSKKLATRMGKRNANKPGQSQNERRSTRKPANSSDESDSDNDKLGKRVTRKSNQFAKTKDKAEDSEDSDEELSPKPKRTRRPILVEKDDRDASDSEKDSKSKKQIKSTQPNTRKASLKTQVSEESEDEEMKPANTSKTGTRKNEKKQDENKVAKGKTKKGLRDESANESEDEVPAKRLKASAAKKSESVSNTTKQLSSSDTKKVPGKKSSVVPPKSKEEPLKKSVPPKASEKADVEADVGTKRTTRVSTPTILPPDVNSPDVKVVKDVSKKPTSVLKKAAKDKAESPKEGVKAEDSEDAGKANNVKLTKDGKIPAKRGRKPKSLVNQTETAKTTVEDTRPTRTRRSTVAVKKESYSELSEVESEESDIALPRTRGRKSNVKYTEKDSEDEESEEEIEEEMKKRPRRSTRAVFCTTLGLEIESDFDDLDDFTAIPIQKPKPVTVEAKAPENEANKDEGKQNKTINKPSTAGSKIAAEEAGKKSETLKSVADKKIKLDDGNASDSSLKKPKALKTSMKDSPPVDQPDIVKILEKKIASAAVDTKPIPVPVPKESCKDPIESSKICVALNGDNKDTNKKTDSLARTDSILPSVPEVKREPPRISRRLSRDIPEKTVELDLVLRVDDSTDDNSPPAKLASSRLGLVGKSIDPIDRTEPLKTVGESFDLPNKEHYEDGLATLADVAFSELQSRKNIMERKLSSDSATSFSSEDVLLPVRRDKIVPKAKADLPTVREKTESDEEISDVGNEETDDGSSYDEFRKSSKQFRRKRLPRRTRKETSRPQSRRPVRSVRLAADSYVDGDLSSSDRSSTPELVQVKPTPKKLKKPDDKSPPKHLTAPKLQSSPAAAINTQLPPSSVLPQVSNLTEPKKVKDVPQLPAKSVRDHPKPATSLRDDTPKTTEPSRTSALHKAVPQQPQVKVSPPNPVSQAELIPTKSHVSLTSPKDGSCVDVRNNNSMTLFSGVSGVRVMKPAMSDNRALLGKPSPVKVDTPRPYQTNQPHAHTKSSNDIPVKSSHPNQPPFPAHQNLQPKDHPYRTFPDAGANLSVLDLKSKPNIGDTWKNAFINAKIPKPGQLSPAHHSSGGTPFVRKQFPNSSKPAKPEDTRPSPYPATTKLPGVQTFKTSAFPQFSKIGSQSPNRMPGSMSPSRQPPSGPSMEPKGNVYLSPARAKGSPAKAEEKVEIKKVDISPQKSLTLLQYEKRSQELISSLKDPQPVLLDGSKTYVQAYPTKLKEYSMEKARIQAKAAPAAPPPSNEETKTEGGKHLNLPFAVEQAFRKRSPITVKKPAKPAVEKKAGPSVTIPETPATANTETPSAPRNQHSSPTVSAPSTRVTTNLDILSKKKVNMTDEEIKKWLEDDSPKVHSKDCGLFENNQCKCSYRTSSESMQNTSILVTEVIKKEEPKVDHGVVEPPVQLRELDSGSKFTAETISTCKVEDYKEKMFSKTPSAPVPEVKKELVPPANVPKPKRPPASPADKAKRKSSMTEDEMCEFDFRFERTSNSPRESGSDMSSPTPRDDVSSSNDEKLDASGHSALERKSIFMQRRPAPCGIPTTPKRSHLSKSPCAFSAENESSVYAFDDAPPPTVSNPFRRRGSRNRSSEDDGPIASSSIAVQVNIESPAASAPTTESNEQVLETSTQTDQNEGQLFYFPLGGDKNPQEVIQGVQVNLQNLPSAEGPEQSVIMKAKLVTKPSAAVSPPSLPSTVRPLSDAGRTTQRPEQKVRPLGSNLEHSPAKPPVVSVQPTVRDPQPSSSVTFNSQGTTTAVDRPVLATRSTQAAASPPSPGPAQSAAAQSTSAQESPPAETPPPAVEPAPAKLPAKSSSTTARRSSPNEFPNPGTTPRMVDAPTFYPTEKEFQDPLEYFDQIMRQAQSFGICRIVPPASFKPECKVSDDMRFTAYNQYVHKMLYRWGPNVREMTAIKKYLATQSIALKQPPWIGGMEIDLPRLYQTVQSWGGLKEVIEKKRWAKVADTMKIPKAAQDRVTKLDDIYCKFLLPYDTLSHSERSKLLEEVDAEWTERERRIALEAERESRGEKEEKEENSESEEESDDGRDECITKGRTMPLSGFYRIARNTMAMWFKEPSPSAKEVENEYWKQVTSRKQHVCVNSGSIDSGSFGYGFPTSKSSSTARHPWNLKVLTNNSGSILRSLGPLMGVTVPTLHVGMLFSACCWYRDPHGLPWIEYAHTGANKIWYAVPDLWNEELHCAMRTILPRYCQDKPIWLASDTAMVPPDLLVQQGVSLCRAVQEPGQFILVFPKAFTSTICTGYIVSESVYFAQSPWLDSASQIFKDIKESCEQPAFSLERLIFSIATDQRSSAEVLTQILPMIIELKDTELQLRKELADLGVTETERLAISKGRKKSQEEQQEYECEICRGNLYLSLVANSVEEANFCLDHSVETLSKDRSHVKNCKLMFSYDEEEMDEVIEKVKQRIEAKSCKKQKATTSSKS